MNTEPVVIMNVVRAVIVLAVVFGLGLPVGADAAILVLAEAVLTLVTRSRVTPAP
jgi:hypothetical protein